MLKKLVFLLTILTLTQTFSQKTLASSSFFVEDYSTSTHPRQNPQGYNAWAKNRSIRIKTEEISKAKTTAPKASIEKKTYSLDLEGNSDHTKKVKDLLETHFPMLVRLSNDFKNGAGIEKDGIKVSYEIDTSPSGKKKTSVLIEVKGAISTTLATKLEPYRTKDIRFFTQSNSKQSKLSLDK